MHNTTHSLLCLVNILKQVNHTSSQQVQILKKFKILLPYHTIITMTKVSCLSNSSIMS